MRHSTGNYTVELSTFQRATLLAIALVALLLLPLVGLSVVLFFIFFQGW